jgi:hypothetical protein
MALFESIELRAKSLICISRGITIVLICIQLQPFDTALAKSIKMSAIESDFRRVVKWFPAQKWSDIHRRFVRPFQMISDDAFFSQHGEGSLECCTEWPLYGIVALLNTLHFNSRAIEV